MAGLLPTLTVVTAVGCGVMGGLFFVFSTFLMRVLQKLPAKHAVATMQAINVDILNPLFGIVFFGTSLTCVALVISAFRTGGPGTALRIAGALLFLVGVFIVTSAANVPMNDKLAKLDASGPAAADYWSHYVGPWLIWNHVRTVASIGAAALLTVASRL